MLKILENNGTEKFGLVTPTRGMIRQWLSLSKYHDDIYSDHVSYLQ